MTENSIKTPETEISTRIRDNNLLNQKREYCLIGMIALSQLQKCLGKNIEDFDLKIYLERIEKINIQIKSGEKIIEDINDDIQSLQNSGVKIPNEIFELTLPIQERLNKLQETKQKLEEFLVKTQLITEYKKDTDKYEKEILEIIDIFK